MSSVGGTRLGAPGGTFAPLALTNGKPLGILKWEAYTCAGRESGVRAGAYHYDLQRILHFQ